MFWPLSGFFVDNYDRSSSPASIQLCLHDLYVERHVTTLIRGKGCSEAGWIQLGAFWALKHFSWSIWQFTAAIARLPWPGHANPYRKFFPQSESSPASISTLRYAGGCQLYSQLNSAGTSVIFAVTLTDAAQASVTIECNDSKPCRKRGPMKTISLCRLC